MAKRKGNLAGLKRWAKRHTFGYVAKKLKGKVSDPEAVAATLRRPCGGRKRK